MVCLESQNVRRQNLQNSVNYDHPLIKTRGNSGQVHVAILLKSTIISIFDVLMDPAFTRPMCTNLLFHEGISNSSAELMGAELGNVGGSSRRVRICLKCVSVCFFVSFQRVPEVCWKSLHSLFEGHRGEIKRCHIIGCVDQ